MTVISSQPELKSIQRDGRSLAYAFWPAVEANTILPPVVCVHGLTRNSRDFDFIAAELSQARDVYCIDVTGRGRSDWLAEGETYSYELYTADVLHLLNELNLTKVDWIGTSMGGIMGMVLASSTPDLFRKVVINDIAATVPLAAMQMLNDHVGLKIEHEDREAAMAYLKYCYGAFGLTENWQWEHLFEHSFARTEHSSYRLTYDPNIMNSVRAKDGSMTLTEDIDLWPFWTKMPQPTLLLRGAKSEFLNAGIAKEMIEKHENATLVEFPNCGHAPALMDDGQIAVVREWLGG